MDQVTSPLRRSLTHESRRSRRSQILDRPRLGGVAAVAVFIAVLLAFTIQSDATTYVQSNLNFKRPYMLFYIGHSSFVLLFPLHLLYLVTVTGIPARAYLSGLWTSLRFQLSPPSTFGAREAPFPWPKLTSLSFMMLVGVTGPALLWYASVPLTSISDITALWNSNAFWAYLFTVKLNRMSFERNKVFAVAIASIGALAIVYGGSASQVVENSVSRYPAPILGDFMALIASIWYGLFQVLYKKFIALPNDPEILHGQRAPLIPNDIDFSTEDEDPEHDVEEALPKEGPLFDEVYPPPFGFHSNFFISTVGLLTIIVMAIPFPFLDYMGWEEFAWPSERSVIIAIILIASMGLIFNAGFMILLGIWGPVITSVGGLLTIVLVLLSDVFILGAGDEVTFWSLTGSAMIIGGFAILAFDLMRP
ncbi:hypothetical protein SISSUDRAFT_976694 [Sistotremastrum suecicum HHB10207 ss-3]|uniref:EamA domain-containing protein n=1 Tax=Sistotremastrum suecicum HHB10207 ss-3 TaxID=1314776 RepID=A0A166JEG8_9AGAM|nr:hypothetical protein SISSUDRAFT_976694 [Sistotremastrum suecicum HHB10207 ss-3]